MRHGCSLFLRLVLLPKVARWTPLLSAMASHGTASPAAINSDVSERISRVVKVRSLEGEAKLNLVLQDCWGRHHRMLRDKDEHVGKTLKRIVLSSLKTQRKRKRTGTGTEVATGDAPPLTTPLNFEAHLFGPSGESVGGEVPNEQAWKDGSSLQVGPVRYEVCVNLPTINSLKLPTHLATGCPVVPQVETEFADTHLWEWLRCPTDFVAPSSNPEQPLDHAHLERLGTSPVYWPSDSDAGQKLLLKCMPVSADGRAGEAETTLSTVVTETPKVTPITRRHLLTPARLAQPNVFRMVSYNTLAGVFTSDEYAQRVLYPYCDPTALAIQYRQGRVVQELLGYNADVLSLQEVGAETFKECFLPALRSKGYDGVFKEKPGSSEGEAIFYDTSRYSLVREDSALLSQFLAEDSSCSELHEGLKSAPSFLKEVMKKRAIVMVALLQSLQLPDSYLLVANTHLYYHPKGDGVRLVQMAVLLNFLRSRVDRFQSLLLGGMRRGARIAAVVGGDMNSCPCIAAYQYLVSGRVEREHKDWRVHQMVGVPQCECYYKHNLGRTMKDGEGEAVMAEDSDSLPPHIQLKLDRVRQAAAAAVADSADLSGSLGNNNSSSSSSSSSSDNVNGSKFLGLELRHDFRFQNVTGTEQCTNFTAGFKAVLDYIVIDSDHLSVDRVVPLPSLEELSEFVALPSIYFPSDHLALVADIKWN